MMRFTSGLLVWVSDATSVRWMTDRWRGRRPGWGEWLAERQPHRSDFLLLRHDDFLGKASELLVAAVAQLGLRHIDRALVMRHHHRDEVRVHVARWLDAHGRHHRVHCRAILGEKWRLRRTCRQRCYRRDQSGSNQ